MNAPPTVTHHTARLNGINQHWISAGDGPPVYLLHGFPETHYAWRKQIPALAEKYTVIAPDLRGYGATEKPAGGYDKRTMANDLAALMDHHGHDRAAVVGHDRGARVGTRFAKDHRERIDRFVAMDNVPTRILAQNATPAAAQLGWFFIFLGVPDLPEALISGREEMWLTHFYRSWSYNPEMLSTQDIDVYVRAYRQPGAIRGAAMDYRAIGEDLAQDTVDAAELISCPVLALWGQDFAQNSFFNLLDVWNSIAEDVRGGSAYPSADTCPTRRNQTSSTKNSRTFSRAGSGEPMKLIAYQHGERRIMATVVDDVAVPFADLEEFWADPQAGLAAAARSDSAGEPIANLTQVPPLPDTARVICAGLNYAAHAAEANVQLPQQPDVFGRWRSTLVVDGHPVPIPPQDEYFDWEGELAIVVGQELRDVTPEAAQAGFLGYSCFNDLSARKYQIGSDRWTLGKNADDSGPLGPWIVTSDEIPDPGRLRIQTHVNGESMQNGNTSNLIFSGAQIAAYASGVMTLKPGDLIVTGTPEGIGATRQPPKFLRPGDTVTVDIEGIGRLTTPIVGR